MVGAGHVLQLQKLFWAKVTEGNNPSTITYNTIKTTSRGAIADFTGDSKREVDNSYVLRCFYRKNLSDKQRQKSGVSQEVDILVYVSPLELQQKTGSQSFPDYVLNSYSNCHMVFDEKHYEIESIFPLENQFDGKNHFCLAWQINLKGSTGIKSF